MARVKPSNNNCQTVLKFLPEFFPFTTIHGLNHVGNRRHHLIERLIWFILVVIAVYSTYILSSLSIQRYVENPTVISMERDRFAWNTSFPPTTICPTSKYNEQALDRYVMNSKETNKTYLREFIVSLAEASYHNFDKVLPYDGILEQDYMKLLLELKYDFRPTVTNSGPANIQYNLEETITEMGICYSFNSKLAVYNSAKYRESGKWDLIEGNETFFVNPLDGEVFASIVNMSTGFEVFLHGPYEVVDVASKRITSPKGYYLQLFISGLTLFSSDNIKGLSVKQRKCRFHYESNLQRSPAYSYVLCRMDCRAALSKRLCGCVPHFYRKLDGERVCNVSGLHCLANYKERLILLKDGCSCLPNCNDVNYVVDNLDTREWFLGSNVQWGLKECPNMRLRRDIIFGFSDLLVYIGGMAGLFLGFSVMSFIEIGYYFTIRLFWYSLGYREETMSLRW